MPLAWVHGQCFDAPVGPRNGWRGCLCPLSLFVFLLTLAPLANASPADPLWVTGVYDAAELDEIVMTVSSLAGVVKGLMVVLERPFAIVVGTVPRPSLIALVPFQAPLVVQARAPPA